MDIQPAETLRSSFFFWTVGPLRDANSFCKNRVQGTLSDEMSKAQVWWLAGHWICGAVVLGLETCAAGISGKVTWTFAITIFLFVTLVLEQTVACDYTIDYEAAARALEGKRPYGYHLKTRIYTIKFAWHCFCAYLSTFTLGYSFGDFFASGVTSLSLETLPIWLALLLALFVVLSDMGYLVQEGYEMSKLR